LAQTRLTNSSARRIRRDRRHPAAIATNISYWNWYGFPKVYTASYMFIQLVGSFASACRRTRAEETDVRSRLRSRRNCPGSALVLGWSVFHRDELSLGEDSSRDGPLHALQDAATRIRTYAPPGVACASCIACPPCNDEADSTHDQDGEGLSASERSGQRASGSRKFRNDLTNA
jgi:hypothetical protein